MINENDFKRILYDGTFLVNKVVSDEIDIKSFVKEYNNFYYYNALDGHEADENLKQLFKKYSDVIELHEQIQTNVVNLVYLKDDGNLQEYLDAGRISVDQALDTIKRITITLQIDKLLLKWYYFIGYQ